MPVEEVLAAHFEVEDAVGNEVGLRVLVIAEDALYLLAVAVV